MANPVLDLSIYSQAELQTLLTNAKTEYALRMSTGRVQQGSSAAQSYGLNVMSTDDLIRLMNGLSAELGLDSQAVIVRPDFNNTTPGIIPGMTVTE